MKTIRIALVQTNPTVGDLAGNRDRIIDSIDHARKLGADIVAFPELAVTGYPPEDLLLKPQFVKDNLRTLKEIRKATTGITAIVGFVDRDKHIYNAAAVLDNGKHVYTYHKILLPNYGVFDEYRYFKPGTRYPVLLINDAAVGISICEDIWFDHGPTGVQARAGAEVIININASPYHKGRGKERLQMLAQRARENKVIITYTNMVGGQDELVFDGHSMVIDKKGILIAAGSQFEEDLIAVDIPVSGRPHIVPLKERGALLGNKPGSIDYVTLAKKTAGKKPSLAARKPEKPLMVCEEVHNALVLGTRDYLHKNGFTTAVIGLSGGIDSSVVAAVAVEALGNKQVTGVFMPSPYSSKESEEDAYALAENLGIQILTIPLDQPFDGYLNTLRPVFAETTTTDVTEENLQARTRGNILMALSNKFGWIVLTTGNKSEMSVGYATLYGDMAGGFAVIKDVPKTMVYEVADCCNRISGRTVIPKRVMTKAPTAELRPDQKDIDALPPYDELDPILKAYVEDDRTFDEILAMGFDRKIVERVIRLVDQSEYKRRQAPPGIKITPRALGRDRRFPITNRYKSF